MTIAGKSIIAGMPIHGSAGVFRSYNPAKGEYLEPEFSQATEADVDAAAWAAQSSFDAYRSTTPAIRAAFLESIAVRIEAIREEIVARATEETGLTAARIDGEISRTAGQLRLFASELLLGEHQGIRIEHGDPDRMPVPRPDLRLRMIPVGPVAIFGASNFPLAFSVAGGDTASAFAAGCPVVVKAHSSHAGTAELVGQQIAAAIADAGLPTGTFSLIFGAGRVVGQALAAHPAIKAIAFTGSQGGGTSLMATAASRTEPIPVYAEMSSINPVIWCQGGATTHTEDRVNAFVASLTLGSGQFCTNPGMLFIPDSESSLIEKIGSAIESSVGQTMLSAGIKEAFDSGVAGLHELGLQAIAVGQLGETLNAPAPTVFAATAQDFLANPQLQEEVFGSAALVITYNNTADLIACLDTLQGQLTATVHFTESDSPIVSEILTILETKAGRVIANGWPTGVEVSHAMVHGGPYPATSDTRTTSVGSLAIHRFQRPVAYQGFPEALMPEPVQESNPLDLPRRVDGVLER